MKGLQLNAPLRFFRDRMFKDIGCIQFTKEFIFLEFKRIGSLWSINTAEFHPLGFGKVRNRVGPILLVWPIFSSRGIDLIFDYFLYTF